MIVSDYALKELKVIEMPAFNSDQLRFMAFNGDFNSVYSLMTRIPSEERKKISDKYILFETITGCINKLNEVRARHDALLLSKERKFLLEVLDQFILVCKQKLIFPRHLFLSILKVCHELDQLSEFDLAIDYLNAALKCGVEKFPDIKTEILFQLADIYNRRGEINTAGNYVNQLINHPYFITDRNRISELITNVSQIYLKQGNVDRYKALLFLGLRYFYTNPDNRRKIYDQIRITYRSSFKLLLNSNVNYSDRLLYFIHWTYFKLPNFSKIKLQFVNKLALKTLLGFIYLLNYAFKNDSSSVFNKAEKKSLKQLQFLNQEDYNRISNKQIILQKNILITRAMGGIGDLLMMTPGIHALKKKYPKSEINLAIPKRYFPIFEGNEDVKLLDIEGDFFNHLKFHKWHNFTDCPAARKESLTAPRVKKSRIEIFSSALNINFHSKINMCKKPRFFFNEEELEYASDYWKKSGLSDKKVIGIQLHSDETYRDYPLMEKLVENISKRFTVMLFDGEVISGFEYENVIKIQHLPIRKAFALAQKCNVIIAPDSSFIHFAAAFDIPTIALFGPIDGKVRTKHYPNCTYLSAKEIFGCLPCWRNETLPCKLTGMRTSECMKQIPVNQIIKTLEQKLNGEKIYA
jgi:ADP-heptose:LPS heptosyltransferase